MSMKRNLTIAIIISAAAFLLLACTAGQSESPRDLSPDGGAAVNDQMPYNELNCDWSGELIRNARYGARAVNGSDTWHFRSVEDLVYWLKAGERSSESLQLYVVDFIDGKRFIGIHDAVYLHSRLRPSPGGHHLSALDKTNEHMKNRVYEAYPGAYLSWDEMIALFEEA
ncbi:MAG: hypothetical protein LAT84_09325 [Balneolia bacterium]|nr:hypothetical protein [Balneolia bacterium]